MTEHDTPIPKDLIHASQNVEIQVEKKYVDHTTIKETPEFALPKAEMTQLPTSDKPYIQQFLEFYKFENGVDVKNLEEIHRVREQLEFGIQQEQTKFIRSLPEFQKHVKAVQIDAKVTDFELYQLDDADKTFIRDSLDPEQVSHLENIQYQLEIQCMEKLIGSGLSPFVIFEPQLHEKGRIVSQKQTLASQLFIHWWFYRCFIVEKDDNGDEHNADVDFRTIIHKIMKVLSGDELQTILRDTVELTNCYLQFQDSKISKPQQQTYKYKYDIYARKMFYMILWLTGMKTQEDILKVNKFIGDITFTCSRYPTIVSFMLLDQCLMILTALDMERVKFSMDVDIGVAKHLQEKCTYLKHGVLQSYLMDRYHPEQFGPYKQLSAEQAQHFQDLFTKLVQGLPVWGQLCDFTYVK